MNEFATATRPIPETKANRLFTKLPRPLRSALAGANIFVSLSLLASCAPGAAPGAVGSLSPEQQAIVKAIQTSEFQLPINGKSWFLGGPHDTNLRGGIKDAIDIGSESVVSCAPGERKVLDNPPVVASASGTVKAIGNERDRTDPLHSIIKIQAPNGLTLGMEHLDQFKVAVGDTVVAGITEIAKLSCENVPGGHTEGMHVHIYLRGPNGEQVPIEGHTFSGYTVRKAVDEYQGSMVRVNERARTADRRRCGPSQASSDACGGIRNDLFTDNQALTANPREGATPLPTVPVITPTIAVPKLAPPPTETPKPVEHTPKAGYSFFPSRVSPYLIDRRSDWRVSSGSTPTKSADVFTSDGADGIPQLTISTVPVKSFVTSQAFAEGCRNEAATNSAYFRGTKFETTLPSPTLTERAISGKKAYEVKYLANFTGNKNNPVELTDLCFVEGGLGWDITFAQYLLVEGSKFKQDSDTYDYMTSTFRIIDGD